MSKRGMSGHIEMTFAFIIFIGFVFFVLIFVKPQDNNYLSGSVVSGADYNFIENVKVDLVTFFVSINNSGDNSLGYDCYQINLPTELISGMPNSSVVRVVDGDLKDSELSADVSVLTVSDNLNSSYYVSLSHEFGDGTASCNKIDYGIDYRFGAFRKDEVISIWKLREMGEEYKNDYEGLREKLAIPSVFEFAIVSDLVSMKKDATNYEISTRDYVYPVLLEDGSIKITRFTIMLWR